MLTATAVAEQEDRTPGEFAMWERLENWGRWGRQDPDCPDVEAGTAHIYDMGRAKSQSDLNPPEAPNPIDERDADNLNGYIQQMARDHKEPIRRYFYLRLHVHTGRLETAIRVLCGLERDNLAVRTQMRGV